MASNGGAVQTARHVGADVAVARGQAANGNVDALAQQFRAVIQGQRLVRPGQSVREPVLLGVHREVGADIAAPGPTAPPDRPKSRDVQQALIEDSLRLADQHAFVIDRVIDVWPVGQGGDPRRHRDRAAGRSCPMDRLHTHRVGGHDVLAGCRVPEHHPHGPETRARSAIRARRDQSEATSATAAGSDPGADHSTAGRSGVFPDPGPAVGWIRYTSSDVGSFILPGSLFTLRPGGGIHKWFVHNDPSHIDGSENVGHLRIGLTPDPRR